MNEYLVAMRESLRKVERLLMKQSSKWPNELAEEINATLKDVQLFALMSIAESLAMLAENAKPPEE